MNRLRKAYQRGVPDARKAKARMELSDDEESSKPTTKASARPSMSPRDSLSPLDGGLSTKAHPSVGNGRNYGGSSYGQTGISATAPNTKTPSTTNLSNKNDDMKPSRNVASNGNTAGTLNRNTAGGDPALSDAALFLLAQRSQDVLDRLASSSDRPASIVAPLQQHPAPSSLPQPSSRQDAQPERLQRQQRQPTLSSPTTIPASTKPTTPSHAHNQSRNKELPPPPPPAPSGPDPRKPLSGGTSTNAMPALVVNINNTTPPAATVAAAATKTDASSISSTDTTSSDILERCRDTRPDPLSLSNVTYGRTTSPTKEVRRQIHDARRSEPADHPSVVQIPQDRRAEWKIPPTPTTPWVVQQPAASPSGGPVQHGRVRVPSTTEMGNQHSSQARQALTTAEQRKAAAQGNPAHGNDSGWRRAARPNGRHGTANLLKKAQGGPEQTTSRRNQGDGENSIPGSLPPQKLQRNSAGKPGAPYVGEDRPGQSLSAPGQDQARGSANPSGRFVTRADLEVVKSAAHEGPNRAWSASSTIRPPVVAGTALSKTQDTNGTVESLPSEHQSSSEENLAEVPLPSIPAPSPLPEDSPHKYGLRDHVETPEPAPQVAQDRTASRVARPRSSGLEIFNEAKTLQSASSFLNGLSTARRNVESCEEGPSHSTNHLPSKDSSSESLLARPNAPAHRPTANRPAQRRSLTPTSPPPTLPAQRPLSYGFKPSGFSYSRPLTRVQWACYRGHARMLPSGDNRHAPVECGVCAEEHVGVPHFSCSWCALRMCGACHRAVRQDGMQAVWVRCAAVSEEQRREKALATSKLGRGTSDDEDAVDGEKKEGAVGVKDGWNSSVDSGVGITAAEAAAATAAAAAVAA